jgi:alpha-glucosidase (family GH31 glycosyl hydrolase)
MEFVFPEQGFEAVTDQFMLGDKLLVAPMLEKGEKYRNVKFPNGKWKASDGNLLKGAKTYQLSVALDQLLYFEKVN